MERRLSMVNRRSDGWRLECRCAIAIGGPSIPGLHSAIGNASALAEREQVQEAPAGDGQELGQGAVERSERLRMLANEMRHDRNGGEDPAPGDERESRALREAQVFTRGTVARVN